MGDEVGPRFNLGLIAGSLGQLEPKWVNLGTAGTLFPSHSTALCSGDPVCPQPGINQVPPAQGFQAAGNSRHAFKLGLNRLKHLWSSKS